ncbi:conserved hypothetical protein [Nostocoides japonicum T1-X7]|uniref:SHOCT domain-containing protein n=1 Tax=Nostocoides japonicum T1-X7 TaxID=1194083 RepID=A0A077LVS7_9MICO|nr:hypothetical protein [Tetrasphaera japonica]CCH76060.1 conserved hypothetical protein [Tetrasphaera japonica T1-X7]
MTTQLTAYASSVLAHPYPGGGFHWWFPVLFFPLGFILFWVVFALVIRAVLWRGRGPWRGGPWQGGPWHGGTQGAEQVLAQRFAAGDIDESDYRARLEVLRSTPPAS